MILAQAKTTLLLTYHNPVLILALLSNNLAFQLTIYFRSNCYFLLRVRSGYLTTDTPWFACSGLPGLLLPWFKQTKKPQRLSCSTLTPV